VVDLPGLRLDALRSWVRATGLGEQVGDAEVVAGGRSNLTYLLALDGVRVVLRRPPLGHVLATAHDMAREHTVQAALDGVVPVPRMLALCEDPDVLGAPFYLMEHVEGVVVRTRAQVDALGDGGLAAAGAALVGTLADLHRVDPAAVGLGAFGRPEGFLGRQARRWSAQLDASRSRDVPEVDALRDRLAASVPDESDRPHRRGVVHGDYRLDNAVIDPTGRTVRAVLDWEMATLGDPLADVGLLLTYSGALGGGPNPISEAMSPDLGWPTGAAIVRSYADEVGLDRDDLDALTWCTAFAHLKLAVICEGIHYRFTQGKTVGEGFDRIGALVAPLAVRGLHLLDDPRLLED
jgi:aminoglycoside phosphotransferase (APT) family kinase protein